MSIYIVNAEIELDAISEFEAEEKVQLYLDEIKDVSCVITEVKELDAS